MITKKNTWVRFAANGPNVKSGHGHKWRCRILEEGGEYGQEIPLKDWKISGVATEQNMTLGTDPKGGTRMDGVVAWIDLFGDVTVQDAVLTVILLDPQKSR